RRASAYRGWTVRHPPRGESTCTCSPWVLTNLGIVCNEFSIFIGYLTNRTNANLSSRWDAFRCDKFPGRPPISNFYVETRIFGRTGGCPHSVHIVTNYSGYRCATPSPAQFSRTRPGIMVAFVPRRAQRIPRNCLVKTQFAARSKGGLHQTVLAAVKTDDGSAALRFQALWQ